MPPRLPRARCTPALVLCALTGLAAGSCALREGGPPVTGRLSAGVPAVHAALLDMARGRTFQLEEEYADEHRSVIRGRFPGGGPLSVRTLRVTPSTCTVSIAYGPFADRRRARSLLAEIGTRLDAP